MKRSLLLSLTLPLLALALSAQDKPVRVHILGASVSGGFRDGPMFGAKEQGDSVTLQQVLKRWADGKARVTTHNTIDMLRFFMDPLEVGERQVKGLARAKPDIVVAIDFPFWFAYGYVGDDEAKGRKERLAQGLAMIADLEIPVLLGDLPDMTGAARRMLNPRQIPGKKLLAELNQQIAAFAKAHKNVSVVELSGIVHEMRDEGITLPLEDGPLPTPKGALQQEDKLHATRLGMAYLGYMVQGKLAAAFAEGHPLHARKWHFEDFVRAAGAEGEVELLQEKAAAANGK